MTYKNAFIKVSEDCPLFISEIPVSKKGKKPQHLIQYELLMERPYELDHYDLIYEVYIRHKEISSDEINNRPEDIKKGLFSKGHPCMRASSLIKRYGFGAHYNNEGKIAIYPMESKEYKAFINDPSIPKFNGMKSKR